MFNFKTVRLVRHVTEDLKCMYEWKSFDKIKKEIFNESQLLKTLSENEDQMFGFITYANSNN